MRGGGGTRARLARGSIGHGVARLGGVLLIAMLLVGAADGILVPSPVAAAPPAGFQNEIILSNLNEPTGAVFAPDGRLIVIERDGSVLVAQPGATQVDPSPLLALSNINISGGERGLVGIALDPGFASTGWFYVFYTAASPLRDRVSRFTASGNTVVPGSELVVWQDNEAAALYHHGGSVEFGPDGRLYVSTGDFFGSGAESQLLTSYRGKILRLEPDGAVPTDNPFVDGAGPNLDAIWARGLRNPFRISFDSGSGRLYIADVGSNSTSSSLEEVNLGVAGANYGWPVCEGTCGTAGMTNPWFTYPHAGRDASITGGFVYRGTQFPAEYRGSYFYGDYVQNWIRGLRLNGDGSIQAPFNFEPANGASDGPYGEVVDLLEGPDGALYYVDFGTSWEGQSRPGTVRRIRYLLANQAPLAVATATPASGPSPLEVSFSSAGSADPEGSPLTYAWDLGDGTTSTEADPVHTYAAVGSYTVRLTVSDGAASSLADPLTITVGNRPTATIEAPVDESTFRAGDVITYRGSGSDIEDGALPASAFSWRGIMRHETHSHPFFGPVDDVTEGSFSVPTMGHDFSGNVSYEIICTVTDADGLSSSTAVSVAPEEVDLTLQTVPAGLTVLLDGVSRTTPLTIDAAIGFQFQVEAPDQTFGGAPYVFASWSDGGTRAHGLTIGTSDQTLTATFQPPPDTTPPTVSVTAPAAGANLSGTTTVTATASDAIGVAGVQFLVDGGSLGAEDTTSPYSVSWNTTTVANGPHTLTARARDAAGNTATSTAVNVVVANGVGLVAAYGFDEGGGATTADRSGNAGTGTISGAAWSPTGRSGAALSFDGVDDLVSVNDSAVLDLTTGMTVEAWVNADVAPTNWRSAVIKERGTNSLAYQLAASSNSSNRPTGRVFAANGVRTLNGGTRLVAGTWTHLATTYDGAIQRLFVNGVQVATRAQTGAIGTTTNALRIGGSVTMGQYFDGRIDEVRVYSRALSAAEIQTDMATPINPPGPDLTPPVVSSPTPSGTLPAGTTQATLGVLTSEPATCRYGTTPGVAYDAMTTAFATTGGTTHGSPVGPLAGGSSYAYYVRCRDTAGNATTTDVAITFSVAAPPPPDTTPPTVSVTSPASGATVGGTVTLTASASDAGGVAGVQFLLDGAPLGAEDTSSPYSVAWNTTTSTNGAHQVAARARDAAGNVTTSAAVDVTVSQPAIDPALRVAYGFNESSGTQARDSSANANNATVTSGSWVIGRIGNGLALNGTSTRARAASNVALTGPFTIEAWVLNPANGAYETILTVGSTRDLYLRSGVLTFYTGQQDLAFGAALPTGTWAHVALTYDSGVLRAYVNGVQQGPDRAATLANVTAALQVGAWIPSGNQNSDYFSGTLDEVRVYGRALSPAEIQTDMVTPIPTG